METAGDPGTEHVKVAGMEPVGSDEILGTEEAEETLPHGQGDHGRAHDQGQVQDPAPGKAGGEAQQEPERDQPQLGRTETGSATAEPIGEHAEQHQTRSRAPGQEADRSHRATSYAAWPVDLHPYGPLREIGKDLFCMEGRWKRSPFSRRMTVVRGARGELAIHSAIRLEEADYARLLDPLGAVTLIVVPNALHGDEARFYAERYAAAQVLVPGPVRERCRAKLPRVDGTIAEAWPQSWAAELRPLQLEGTRMGEALFLHAPSGSLITTDLVFHFTDELSGIARRLMQWNGVVGRVGPSRIFRWFFLTDRTAFARSLAPVRAWDFDRVVMSHGTIVEGNGKQRFLAGFSELL